MKTSAMIFVVATRKRPAIVLEALNAAQAPHKVCWTTDYKLEEGWLPHPAYASMVQNQVGALRCWRGHQDALRCFRDEWKNADVALVLEDDAWPVGPDWTGVCADALSLMDDYEVVSLHGRAFRPCDFDAKQIGCRKLLVPQVQGSVWVQGSLAYLIRRDAVDRWINDSYNGYPSDIYLCNRFKFALVDPSPFLHERKHGSLIDCKTPTD